MREVWVSKEKGRNPDDYRPDMPPLERSVEYLIGYLYEIGPALGDGPITQQEIGWWQRNTGIRLTSWQARTLRRLSQDYLSERRKGEKRGAQPPWQPDGAKPIPTAAQLSIRAVAST